jgi:ring-1,2-phenylacetyl-CoA epoxidase subunit PaaD
VVIATESKVEAAWALLRRVPDPEVPVLSVVEFGMVREVEQDEDGLLTVTLTPTYSGCPATEAIADDVRAALAPLGPVRLTTRLDPPWTTDWLSSEAKEKLRAYGIAPPCAGGEQRIQIQQSIPCPRCHSPRSERLSAFGSTACKALYRCLSCREPFEYFKPL